MGFSIAIMAYAREDKNTVLDAFDWSVSDQQVGEAIDLATVSIEDLMSPAFQAANDPHFSAADGVGHFLVYTSLKSLKTHEYPDFAALSVPASMTVLIVVETSLAGTIEMWQAGQRVWSVGGASNIEYDVQGKSPIDLNALAEDYRAWFAETHALDDDLDPDERVLPESNEEVIVENFLSLLDNWFAGETGFRYAGDHPPLYRLIGDLPVIDGRMQ